jgi:hypothetical protein
MAGRRRALPCFSTASQLDSSTRSDGQPEVGRARAARDIVGVVGVQQRTVLVDLGVEVIVVRGRVLVDLGVVLVVDHVGTVLVVTVTRQPIVQRDVRPRHHLEPDDPQDRQSEREPLARHPRHDGTSPAAPSSAS